ncbi:hypothetical protein Trydic_g20669 [Trypoxylus dichotomus]
MNAYEGMHSIESCSHSAGTEHEKMVICPSSPENLQFTYEVGFVQHSGTILTAATPTHMLMATYERRRKEYHLSEAMINIDRCGHVLLVLILVIVAINSVILDIVR